MPNGADIAGDHKKRREVTQMTVDHARSIINNHGSMSDVSIRTAEATAQLVNRGKILPRLLKHLTLPTVKKDKPLSPSQGTADTSDKNEESSLVAADSKKQNKKKKKKSNKNKNLPDSSGNSVPTPEQHGLHEDEPLLKDRISNFDDRNSHYKHDSILHSFHNVNGGCTMEGLNQAEGNAAQVNEIEEGKLFTDPNGSVTLVDSAPLLQSEGNHAEHHIPNSQHYNPEAIQEKNFSPFDSPATEVIMSQKPVLDKEVYGKERRATPATKHDADEPSLPKGVLNVLAPAFLPEQLQPCIPLRKLSMTTLDKTKINQEAKMEGAKIPESISKVEDSMSAKAVSEQDEVTSEVESEESDAPTERARNRRSDPEKVTSEEDLEPQNTAKEDHHTLAKQLPLDDATNCDDSTLKDESDPKPPTPAVVPPMIGLSSSNSGQFPKVSTGPVFGGGAQGLRWAYATNTPFDQELYAAGIWLCPKPATYYRPKPLFYTASNSGATLAPVLIAHGTSGLQQPQVEFDGKVVRITPHNKPWKDTRSSIGHPDFLVPIMLTEYQACEWAGYQMWRHNRNFMACRRPGCELRVIDCNGAIICLGCGPKTKIRYCSVDHQIEHMREHWRDCGHRDLIIQQVIDHSTEPPHFPEMCPAIKERHGFKSFAVHRQRHFVMLTGGHYTLFNVLPLSHTVLFWPKSHKHWKIVDERIERLLNALFFDQQNFKIREHLFRLLRHLLYLTNSLSTSNVVALESQFYVEFGRKPRPGSTADHHPPCECEWNDPETKGQLDGSGYVHRGTPECSPSGGKYDWGSGQGMGTVQRQIEQLEDKFWILRAWQQQHPEEKEWRKRAAEEFYDGGSGSMTVKLGPGWVGWGAEEDNICVSDEVGGVWG